MSLQVSLLQTASQLLCFLSCERSACLVAKGVSYVRDVVEGDGEILKRLRDVAHDLAEPTCEGEGLFEGGAGGLEVAEALLLFAYSIE